MKTIIVFDVPAENGGALTILNQYYNQAVKNKTINWIFVISKPELKSTENVEVLRYPWIKKSWFHRAWFDIFFERKIIKRSNADEVLSLQNSYLRTKKFQTIYIHNPLPFSDIKFSFFKEFKMWLYKKIQKVKIKKSLNNGNKIIVQTNWMKDACLNVNENLIDKIEIIQPELNKVVFDYKYKLDSFEKTTFFYPAANFKYKDHLTILKAAAKLPKDANYEIIFTLDKNDSSNNHLVNYANEFNLKINFIGKLTYEQVLNQYCQSTLLFPSYLETFGLPLKEASTIGAPVIAANTPFAQEILKDYLNKEFFSVSNEDELAIILAKHINKIK